MPTPQIKLLVVDDEPSILMLLSQIFTQLGYSVGSAEDGFSALREIRLAPPDVILSDLNMPGMSGFELLSIVRRRFPEIQVIAMSAAFSGDDLPPYVAADAFYEKATDLNVLLQVVKTIADPRRPSLHLSRRFAPIWIATNGHDSSGEAYITIACPECLRAFPQVLGKTVNAIRTVACLHCLSLIHYAIHPATDHASPLAFQQKPIAKSLPRFNMPLLM